MRKGFTLMEILVVTALIGLIAGIFSWWVFSKKSEKKISSENVCVYNLKAAMIDMSNHFLHMKNIIEIGDDEIIAKDINNKHFSYYVNGKNELIRASLKGLDEKVIAKNIDDIKLKLLTYQKYALIKFSVKMLDGTQAKSSIFLRYYE